MMATHTINNKERIRLKLRLPSFKIVWCLQKKKRFGWKTVSYVKPSFNKKDHHCISDDSLRRLIQELEYTRETNSIVAYQIDRML